MRIRTLVVAGAASAALLAPAGAAQAATCATPDAAGGEWPSYGGTLDNHRNQTSETTIGKDNVADLGEAWRFTAPDGGTIHSTPTVAGGCVYTGTNKGAVYALNADTGALVWTQDLGGGGGNFAVGAGIIGSPAYSNGVVYATGTKSGTSKMAAFNAQTGSVIWTKVIDSDSGAGADASPLPFNGMVFQGFQGDESSNHSNPGFVIVDAATGNILVKTPVIPAADYANGFRGGSIVDTPALDLTRNLAFAGTGNPASPKQHPRTNSLLKIDIDPASPTFGEILASHRGKSDSYPAPSDVDVPTCPNTSSIQWPVGRVSCAEFDYNFLSSPNLWTASDGRELFGGLQKAGVFTTVDSNTMEQVWQTTLGAPCLACNLSSTAVDENGIYVAVTGGNLYSLNRDTGLPQWVTPLTGALRYNGLAVANGVVYSLNDAAGALQAFDASNGVPLFVHEFKTSDGNPMHDIGNSSGVSVARGTVFATSQTTSSTSTLFALKPGAGGGSGLPDPGEVPLPDTGDAPTAGGQIVSGPGAASYGYLTPAMVTQVGGPLSYTNGDIAQHDVVSRETRNGEPLFKTPLIGLGATAEVEGLDNVESGNTYEFFCTLHAGMKGTLVVR